MKKYLIFFVVLALGTGMAATVSAQDDSIGLTAGLEFFFKNANKVDVFGDKNTYTYMNPYIYYEKSFLDGAIDLYAELNYNYGFRKIDVLIEPEDEDEEEDEEDQFEKKFEQELWFDFSLGYNIRKGDTTVSFVLENEYTFFLSPRSKDGRNVEGIFIPKIIINQGVGIGDIYTKANMPITFIQDDKEAKPKAGLNLIWGWGSNFGLGLELEIKQYLYNDEDKTGYAGLNVTASYETGPFYAEVKMETPKSVEESGISIKPEIEYSFNIFTFYGYIRFDCIGMDDMNTMVSPGLGVKVSF